MKKTAVTQEPILDVIADRWSGRAYNAEKPVSNKQLISLLEAARWAPSCYGDQPWRFIVWDKNQDAAAWQKAYDCIVPGINQMPPFSFVIFVRDTQNWK